MATQLQLSKPILKKWVEKIGMLALCLIIIIFLILFWFSYTTRQIPLSAKANSTDAATNRTIELTSIYSYAFKGYIYKERSFEEENRVIPKGSFPFEGALLIAFLVVVLHIADTRKKEKPEPAKLEEIREVAKEYLEYMKKEGLILEYSLYMGGFLKEKQVDSGDHIAKTWMLPAEVFTPEGEGVYRWLGLDPFTRAIQIDWKMDKEFKGEDTCPICGKFFHMKVITPEGFTIWRDEFAVRGQR